MSVVTVLRQSRSGEREGRFQPLQGMNVHYLKTIRTYIAFGMHVSS